MLCNVKSGPVAPAGLTKELYPVTVLTKYLLDVANSPVAVVAVIPDLNFRSSEFEAERDRFEIQKADVLSYLLRTRLLRATHARKSSG